MGKYDYKKTLVKGLKQLIIIVVAGVASVYGESPIYLALAPLINMGLNFIKHRKD